MDNLYVVAGTKPWNKEVFDKIKLLPGSWIYIETEEELKEVSQWNPRYIFFLHWSTKVPKEITDRIECVCFHPTALPEGRGGSPIQHQILNGHEYTYLTVFRMTDEIDAGPVYLRGFLPLSGSLQDIFAREMDLALECINQIVIEEMEPEPQEGITSFYKRRTPDQSEITEIASLHGLYDFIRMLDAETYPRAFVKIGDKVLEFSNVKLYQDHLSVSLRVK